MTTTIGRVEFIVSLDGKRIPVEAKALGKVIGREMGDGLDSSFQDQLTKIGARVSDKLGAQGKLAGERFGSTFDRELQSRFSGVQNQVAAALADKGEFRKFADNFLTVDEAVQRLQSDLQDLAGQKIIDDEGNERLVLTKKQLADFSAEARRLGSDLTKVKAQEKQFFDGMAQFSNLRSKLDETWESAKRFDDELINAEHSAGRFENAIKSAGNNSGWKNLSANTRQWTLIIGAIAAGGSDIGALGSAAGAGLVALGSALSSAVAGGAVAYVAFKNLTGSIEDLPPAVQDAAGAFQDLKKPLADLQDFIETTALANSTRDWQSLGNTIRAITPAFAPLSQEIGNLVHELADNLAPGTEAFSVLEGFLRGSAPIFHSIAADAGTLGLALLRGFTRAQPEAQKLVGWIGRLIGQFDKFTQSDDFDVWLRNADSVLTHLGGLLDSTGRMLDNLVTKSAIDRLNDFTDNLSEFMPNLGRLLDVLGRLDVFGLLAQGLNDFGQALEPLAGPAADLADALRRLLSISISEFADALGGLAQVLAPVVQAFADFLNALPPDVIQGLANGLLVLAGAFVVLRGAMAIGSAMDALDLFGVKLGKLGPLGTTAASGLSKFTAALPALGTLGLIAAGAVAVGAALHSAFIPSVDESTAALKKAGSAAEQFQTGIAAVTPFGVNIDALSASVKTLGKDLDEAQGTTGWLQDISGFIPTSITAVQGLSDSFAELAQTNLPLAQQKFEQLTESANLNSTQSSELIDKMGSFKDALSKVADQQGLTADSQTLLNIAMGETGSKVTSTATTLGSLHDAALDTSTSITDLSNRINGFGSANLDARSAARDYQQSLADLSKSIQDNGTSLDIATQKGRDNEAAIDALAQSIIANAGATKTLTGSQDAANATLETGRQALIKMLASFGIAGSAAETYADKLGLIPAKKNTVITADTTQASNALGTLVKQYDGRVITLYVHTDGSITIPGSRVTAHARGTITSGPEYSLIGEAGREAVVPLDRPLSQVDPSVRALSAIAQGLSTTALAGGGTGGGGSTTLLPGSVVIQDARDPYRTGLEVVDAIAEKVNS